MQRAKRPAKNSRICAELLPVGAWFTAPTGFSFLRRDSVMKHTRLCSRLAEYIRNVRKQERKRIMIAAIVAGLVALVGVGASAFLAALGIFL
ncbi:hypothetical protein ACFWF7_00800 [Nocardia sp. NPDC060256]|uniref:hypothetical protein n=1 Tax=Nocardia sp. NPDC060256 TaxID=3347086 RepID=UPI0036626F58